MAVHPLRPATRRRLGRPLPHQQADRPRAHPIPQKLSNHTPTCDSYPVLDPVSQAYPEVQGRSPTCYSPVRHSSTTASCGLSVRLACVKHAASVHPEPGSNSPQKRRNSELVKSPNPTKTNHTTPQEKPARQYWQNLQFKKYLPCNPNTDHAHPTRKTTQPTHQTGPHPRFITIKPHTMTQNMRHRVTSPSKVHDTTTSTHPPTQKCRPGTPQCTPQQTTNKNKKVHWHTIEFSHNTPAVTTTTAEK